jgi:hypothetical protein
MEHKERLIKSGRSNDDYSVALLIQSLIRVSILLVVAIVFIISARQREAGLNFTLVISLTVVTYIFLEIVVYVGKLKFSAISELRRLEITLEEIERVQSEVATRVGEASNLTARPIKEERLR